MDVSNDHIEFLLLGPLWKLPQCVQLQPPCARQGQGEDTRRTPFKQMPSEIQSFFCSFCLLIPHSNKIKCICLCLRLSKGLPAYFHLPAGCRTPYRAVTRPEGHPTALPRCLLWGGWSETFLTGESVGLINWRRDCPQRSSQSCRHLLPWRLLTSLIKGDKQPQPDGASQRQLHLEHRSAPDGSPWDQWDGTKWYKHPCWLC